MSFLVQSSVCQAFKLRASFNSSFQHKKFLSKNQSKNRRMEGATERSGAKSRIKCQESDQVPVYYVDSYPRIQLPSVN